MKKTFSKLLLIPGLVAGTLVLQGCETLEPCDKTGSVGVTVSSDGATKAEAKMTVSCKGGGGEVASNDFFGRLLNSLYASSDQSLHDVDFSALNMELSATNAYIYNKPGKVQVTLRDDGSVIATRQFDYIMSNNLIQLADPAAARSWALGYEGIATGVDIGVADLVGGAGTGSISVTQTSRYDNEVIASGTGHTYVDDGGCFDCAIK
ncbi:MAG: hypothetical protein ACR2J7_04635 [Luteimonas sp.]